MSRTPTRGAEFWATVVAEAKRGAIPRSAVAAKHGVSDAALKYHLYKTTGSTAVKSKALALLPESVAPAPALPAIAPSTPSLSLHGTTAIRAAA